MAMPFIAPSLLYYGAPPVTHPAILGVCYILTIILGAYPIFAISWKHWWGYIAKLAYVLVILLCALTVLPFLFLGEPLRTVLIENTKCNYLRQDVARLSDAKQQKYRTTHAELFAQCTRLQQEYCQKALVEFNALDAEAQQQWVARRGKPDCSQETK